MYFSFPREVLVIRKGFEPLTHSLEGCCSNPTELPDHPFLPTLSSLRLQSYKKNIINYKL